jgi:hypothetical protein
MPARPRKTRPRAKHQVDAYVKVRDMTRAGTSLELNIYSAGRKVGVLTLGQGSMIWKRGARKPQRVRWEKFSQLMDDLRDGLI